MSGRKDLPSPSTPNWAQRVTEEVRTLMGKTGSAADRALTIGNLPNLGPQVPGGWWNPGNGNGSTEPDLTPPPTPTGFELSAAISHVFIEHDAPLYTVGHGHARTILYGAKRTGSNPPPTFSDAVVLAEFTGTVWAYPSDPATTWHMWIFWESVDGVRSSIPAGGTNGLTATTGQDVSLLLGALSGKITESELYSALGARIALIDGSGPGSVNARILNEATTRQTADTAEALARTTLAASIPGAISAAVSTEASVRASVDGYLGAQQTVRVDIAGHVSGYGIAGSSPDGTAASATSAFGVRANTFFVAPPSVVQATAPTDNLYDGFAWVDTSVTPNVTRYRSGGTWTVVPPMLPFVIQTTPTTINGVPVPAGVYMADAYIRNGTIVSAKIGNLAVDDAKIANLSVSKILAGSMVVGQYITSANYISGVQGWAINAAGTAEFSNAVVRGGVYAGYGAIGGILIGGGNLYSANYVYNSSGFALFQDGWIHAANVRLRGSIMGGAFDGYGWPAAGGGFYVGAEGLLVGNANTGKYFQLDSAGNVYAPGFSIVNGSATFSGNLTAEAINAVGTINLAGNSVTVPASAYSGDLIRADGPGWTLEAQTLTIWSDGLYPVLLFFGTHMFSSRKEEVGVRLVRNGVTLWEVGNVTTNRGYEGVVEPEATVFGSRVDHPPAGWTTYSLQLGHAGNHSLVAHARTITAMTAKR